MNTISNITLPQLLIFASGSKEGGGSGFANLVAAQQKGILKADIVGVVSNHEFGGVREHATRLGVPFYYFPLPREAEDYKALVEKTGADFVALSGWLKLYKQPDSKKTFNIHPSILPWTKGTYGHFAHEAALEAYKRGDITHSAVTMHFVDEEYDKGPIFFEVPVAILPDDTADTLAKRVNTAEHFYQPMVTDAVVNGRIHWDGVDPASLFVPDEFKNLPVFEG